MFFYDTNEIERIADSVARETSMIAAMRILRKYVYKTFSPLARRRIISAFISTRDISEGNIGVVILNLRYVEFPDLPCYWEIEPRPVDKCGIMTLLFETFAFTEEILPSMKVR